MYYIGRMTQIDQWEEKSTRTGFLAECRREGVLGLVLGAGLSNEAGLPGWNELLARMERRLKEKKQYYLERNEEINISEHLSNEERAGCIHKLFEDNEENYNRLVKDSLYDGKQSFLGSWDSFPTLNAISMLCTSIGSGYVNEVLTFNFDSVLEDHLIALGLDVNTHYSGSHKLGRCDVNVYHVHGYLPSYESHDKMSKKIIFDTESFKEVMNKDWEWRRKSLLFFQQNICLFIGLSGRDENMGQLLSKAYEYRKKYHHTFDLFWGVSFAVNPNEEDLQRWMNWGIYPVVVSIKKGEKYSSDIVEELRMISRYYPQLYRYNRLGL